ncbi:MAG: hypothetical protein ACYC0V_13125 [Armatimonadota bacterium]
MRSFRSFTTRWPISALCIAVLLGPILIGLIQSPAAAQSGTMEVAVVDFLNLSKTTPDAMYAKMATDAVVVELLRSGKFSVTADDALKSKMVELGFRTQDDQGANIYLTDSNLQRLGQEVGATSVITGEISTINIDDKKKKAEVRVAVRMLDVASGEWINGAVAVGVSHARVSYESQKDADSIIEAINDAARKAVDSMVSYIIPEATILGTAGTSEILMNRGTQDGIKTGMDLIVLRRGETGIDEVVGKIRVQSVSDTDSRAKVVNAPRGVKPGDHVRAIFKLPEVSSTGQIDVEKSAKAEKRVNKRNSLFYGLVALVGIAAFMKGGRGRTEAVPGAVAVAAIDPDIGILTQGPGVMVLFNSPSSIGTQNILEYHIWRDEAGTLPGGSSGGGIGPVWVTDEFTSTPRTTPFGKFDHLVVLSEAILDPVSHQYPSQDHTSLTSVSITGVAPTNPGYPHPFWVSCLYQRFTAASGITTYWETVPSFAGRATSLRRPTSVAPGAVVTSETVDLSEATFQWLGTLGADTYVIELCPFPDFRRSATWVQQYFQPTPQDLMPFSRSIGYTNVSDALGIKAWIADMQKIGKLTITDPVVYWRVGARAMNDTPGPYPTGDANAQVSGPKNTRYIYSDPNNILSFNVNDDVPPPPGQ